MVKRAGQNERQEKAAGRAADLEAKLVRLVVTVKAPPEGLQVTRHGAARKGSGS